MWNRTENQIKLILIRHGETNANKEHRYLGKTDEQLSERGICLLQQAREAQYYPPVDYLFTSPMRRCIQTADILYPENRAEMIPEWEEMDFGIFEGKNYRDLWNDKQYQAWIDSNATLPFPGGESREEFIGRCKAGLYRMLEYLSGCISHTEDPFKEKQTVVGAVVHGGTVMALLSSFYGGEYFDYQISNGRGYSCVLQCDGEKIRLDDLRKL